MISVAGGQIWTPSPAQLLSPASVFRTKASELLVSEDQTLKEKLANQLLYNHSGQSGKFYGYSGMGYGGAADGYQVTLGFAEYSIPFYIAPAATPRVPVWLVNGNTEELREPGYAENLQASLMTVPMPNPTLTPLGAIEPKGTDKAIVIYCPATDEMWEFETLSTFAAGSHKGEWKCDAGAYIAKASQSVGVPPNKWGVSASKLSLIGGDITMTDLVRVLRGGTIGHALRVAIPVEADEAILPALGHDSAAPISNPHEFLEDGKTANPAFGLVDAVPIGLRCAFHADSRASDYGIKESERLATGFYEGIRENGLIVQDHSANSCEFYLCDGRSLFSPYSDVGKLNPFANTTNAGIQSYIGKYAPAGSTDPTLPVFTESLYGLSSVLRKIPWRELEQYKAVAA